MTHEKNEHGVIRQFVIYAVVAEDDAIDAIEWNILTQKTGMGKSRKLPGKMRYAGAKGFRSSEIAIAQIAHFLFDKSSRG